MTGFFFVFVQTHYRRLNQFREVRRWHGLAVMALDFQSEKLDICVSCGRASSFQEMAAILVIM